MTAVTPVLPINAQKLPITKTPKNIILMVGDGMGTAQIFAGLIANNGKLNLMRCTAIGFQKTQSADNFVTDSGAGATAFAIGKKTKNGAISVDANGKVHPTILETAKQNGLATGIVVTCSITHATPACFYAHQASRMQVEDIAADMLKGNVDVFIGGGRRHFTHRVDGRDLVEALQVEGYQIANSTDELGQFTTGKVGAFTADLEPGKITEGRGDVLLNGITAALSLLSQNKKGFFLMVEGSQIDWGGHENDSDYVISEVLDFDKSVGAVLEFARKDGDTLVVITADHETGGFAITHGDSRKGKLEGRFATGDHTGVMVPVFAYGPGSEAFIGIYENTAVFDKMMAAYKPLFSLCKPTEA